MSALVTYEIFRLFFNTLTPDDRYSRRNIQIFWQQLQTPFSQKGKAFCPFSIAFLKCAWNLKHSEKKEDYYRNHCIRRRCLLKRLKGCFSTPFGNQRVNGFETLLKSARHHHFPIFQWIWDKLSWKMSPFVTSQIFWLFVNTLTPDDK